VLDAVVIVGGGGHASVCLDVLRRLDATILGCLAAEPPVEALGIDYLGGDDRIAELASKIGGVSWVVAIGDGAVRRRLIGECMVAGGDLPVIVDTTALVSPSAAIGSATVVFPRAVVNARVVLGVGVIINTAAVIEHDVCVGAYSHIAPGAVLAGGVQIGRDCLVGVGARLLPGVTIGAGSVIGGGAVVVDDVAAGEVVVGVPARPR
jgi:sugar O-acyltransferase (sialic acid O-acetyltransferase NeuD family)